MLKTLWQQRFQGGVIDCHYHRLKRTIAVGDSSGQVTLLDTNGGLIGQCKLALPVWGVWHDYDERDRVVITAAEASKSPERGAGTLIYEFAVTQRLEFPGPGWDCWVSCVEGRAAFTCWDGKVNVILLDDWLRPSQYDMGGACFGLKVESPASLLVCVSGIGVRQVDLSTGIQTDALRSPKACYNVDRGQGGMIICGGSGQSAYLHRSSTTKSLVMMGEGVTAVASAGPFVLVGDLSGCLRVFLACYPNKPLSSIQIDDHGVWHLEFIEEESRLLVAGGSGSLHCLYLDAGRFQEDKLEAFVSAPFVSGRAAQTLRTFRDAVPTSLITLRLEQQWGDLGPDDLRSAQEFLIDALREGSEPRAYFLLAQSYIEVQQFEEAIRCFQQIDSVSEYYVLSLLPLARAFQAIGLTSSAIRTLRANIERIPTTSTVEFAFELGLLYEVRSDLENAANFFEIVTSLDVSYRDVMRRLRAIQSRGQLVPQKEPNGLSLSTDEMFANGQIPGKAVLGRQRSDFYDLVTYLKYEYAPPADEAKKLFEADLMEQVLSRYRINSGSALDIGCATGRWPMWFSRKGFRAVGFDISPASIQLCKTRAAQAGDNSVRFECRNIVVDQTYFGDYEIITCMMGTFNHVPWDSANQFCRRVFDALVPGGLFVFTSWNPQSPFVHFLSFDGQLAKESLRKNCQPLESLTGLLAGQRFDDIQVVSFCMLPNECYDAWENEFDSIDKLIEADQLLRVRLSSRTAQMFFVTARKPHGVKHS